MIMNQQWIDHEGVSYWPNLGTTVAAGPVVALYRRFGHASYTRHHSAQEARSWLLAHTCSNDVQPVAVIDGDGTVHPHGVDIEMR